MFTRHYHVITFSRFKTHWSFRSGLPCQVPSHVIRGYSITYELTFATNITDDQRKDAIRYFEQSALTQDKQILRAQFVGLFARRAALAWSVAA